MVEFYTNQKDSLTHSMIVHELLKKITVELGTKEFKGGYKKPVIRDGVTYLDYIPDSRSEYIQAVESLSDILLPQYDEVMIKKYKAYCDELKKLEKQLEDKDVRMGDEIHSKYIKEKLKLIKTLFRELNLLLKRTNYLKSAPYSEEDIHDDEEKEGYQE